MSSDHPMESAQTLTVTLLGALESEPCSVCGGLGGSPLMIHGRWVDVRREQTGERICVRCAIRDEHQQFLDTLRVTLRSFLCTSPLGDLALPEMAEVFITEPNSSFPAGVGYYVFGQLRVFLVDPTFPIPEGADRVILFFTEVTADSQPFVVAVSSNVKASSAPCRFCNTAERMPVIGVRGRYDEVTLVSGDYVCWNCVRQKMPGLMQLYQRLQRKPEPVIDTGFLS